MTPSWPLRSAARSATFDGPAITTGEQVRCSCSHSAAYARKAASHSVSGAPFSTPVTTARARSAKPSTALRYSAYAWRRTVAIGPSGPSKVPSRGARNAVQLAAIVPAEPIPAPATAKIPVTQSEATEGISPHFYARFIAFGFRQASPHGSESTAYVPRTRGRGSLVTSRPRPFEQAMLADRSARALVTDGCQPI